MKLIVGLGNPGKKYKNTKHNLGFNSIDKLSEKLGVSLTPNKKILGDSVKYENIILLKPTTFMNLSGNSIIKTMKYYDISKDDILIIYDDIDLPIGKIRIRYKGGSGGHNGIKSIIQHIDNDFNRIRIGAGRDDGLGTVNYVLTSFSKKDQLVIDESIDKVINICMDFIKEEDILTIMNKYN
ncbi:aminoacyl-tRNA hydrolase [Mycoplasmatota bacterium]|nr:aminoacyl-tRNA hydrolase [Mycoplasmatota bacterium]